MKSSWRIFAVTAAAVLLTGGAAHAGDTPSPDGAKVYIINVQEGDTVQSPVLVQFGLSGMGIAPAGVEDIPDTGHHHLLINDTLDPSEYDDVIPADDNHRHFGGGQTEASIELPPGQHTLQLVLGDWSHIPHDPPVFSEPITVTVE
ncbi:DUF4399 domain-containing protein [Roseibium denhamense]|uniref:DUF4399 domain-containing protein n=1 Tax=Roseibium denhamense TaxID=76305 RepID=A0ABY1PLK4_9HYPH|nr:DUF4399 domain-containing protein [Roseibium denhamense]MTI04226.1 DUF4399 domain-containing protein [Roseibium denhamense]SMP36864.1 protein of unknown function [Roseibium denhamense]